MKIRYLLICLLFIGVLNRADAQKNLIYNGGFEDDLYGWNNNGAAKTTPWDFKTGKNSCAIIAANVTGWAGIDQVVKIPKKVQIIEFSAWIKTTNVIKGKNDWDGAVFTVVFLDGRDKELGNNTSIATLTGDQNWKFFSKTVQIPANASSFKILAALGNASGTMLVDDITAKVEIKQ